MNNKSKLLASLAKLFIGIDITPENLADNEVACAESVSKILHLIDSNFPEGILSTADLKNKLAKSKLFVAITKPEIGCVVVDPRTKTVNGHTGIYITDSKIVSNDSSSGKMMQNYTTTTWEKTFVKGRGLTTYYFKFK
jgi:hypothetical protein